MRIRINPWPNGHTAAAVLRDDDVSYFTSPDKIEQIYNEAWKIGFKVSLGVIPNARAINDPCVPPSYRGKLTHHKVCDNRELVAYLKEKIIANEIDIAQHGYAHEMLNQTPEFCISDSDKIEEKLKAGRKILEECFPTKISVFIPPWGSISKQASDILRKYGLALCGEEKRLHIRKSFGGLFPAVRNLARNIPTKYFHSSAKSVVWSSDIIELHPSFDWWSNKHRRFIFGEERVKEASQEFEKTIKREDLFCLLNHHWGFYQDWEGNVNKEMLESFYSILQFINGSNVWKTTASEIIDWIRKVQQVKIHTEPKKLTLRSSATIRGLTIKGEGCTLVPATKADVRVQEKNGNSLLVYELLEAGKSEEALIKSD